MTRSVVLVVDDVPELRTITATLLEAAGFDIAEEESGEDALAYLHTIIPDLVLMDVTMPGIGGVEACRRMRANPRLRYVPVMFVTAVADPELVEIAKELGAEILKKPFDRHRLIDRARALTQDSAETALIERPKAC